MKFFSTLLAGILFGTGFVISGMADPAKVQNFLDIFGRWDPSLAFVMGGAIAVAMPGFWWVQKRATPFFSDIFHLPRRSNYDAHLVVGAATFGIGWGLGGFCPGPAITALPIAASGTLVFVPAMLIGMAIAKFVALRVWRVSSD